MNFRIASGFCHWFSAQMSGYMCKFWGISLIDITHPHPEGMCSEFFPQYGFESFHPHSSPLLDLLL